MFTLASAMRHLVVEFLCVYQNKLTFEDQETTCT